MPCWRVMELIAQRAALEPCVQREAFEFFMQRETVSGYLFRHINLHGIINLEIEAIHLACEFTRDN